MKPFALYWGKSKLKGGMTMARGDQLGRQWRIIQTLISSKFGKSASELADELECHPRTLYRDLEALQVAGFPIYQERVEGKNLWSVLDTVKHQIPIPFSLTELMALYFSLDMLKVFKETAFHDSLESLFKKVKTTLPPESVKYLGRVEQTLHVGIKPYKHYGKFREIIDRVNEAAAGKKSIEIAYYTMSRKKETTRKVDPYRIWFFNGTFYLIGHCHLREQVRVFALDRIKMLHLTKENFKIPEGFNLDDFLRPSFGVFQGEPTKVKILFDREVAGYIAEKVWHETQDLHPQADGSLIFEAEVAGTDEIKFWVMNWGSKAVVLEPASLREDIRAEAAAVLARYGREAGRGAGRAQAGSSRNGAKAQREK
jgi:predicted DNA-binding transcriptional regulator YafY